MLYEAIKSLSKHSYDTKKDFYDRISLNNIEEFLLESNIATFKESLYPTYKELKEALIKELTTIDDNEYSLLDSQDIDLLSDLLIIAFSTNQAFMGLSSVSL